MNKDFLAGRTLVTGATGFVGRQALLRLQHAIVLSRDVDRATSSLPPFDGRTYSWDPRNKPVPAEALEGIDTVIHLAGEPVADGRWTSHKKRRLCESRVAGTRHLVESLAARPKRPRVLVSASAIGYYGSCGDDVLDETSPPQDDFLAELCVAWEREAGKARRLGMRVVTVRIGIVLGRNGGALSKMLTPFRLCLGSRLGNGKQWMSWIHLDDLVHMLLFAAQQDQIDGPLNGTAPKPVTNQDFTHTLRKVLRRPSVMPVMPGLMLQLIVGEFGKVLLTSQRALPKAAEAAGFHFQYPELELALREILDAG